MRAIDEIYDAVVDDLAYARLPAVLAQAVDARTAVVLEFDQDLAPISIARHAIPDEINDRYVQLDLARHDVWTQAIARDGRLDRAVLIETYIDADQFRRTVFFNEMYGAVGDDTARCLGTVMRRPDGFMSVGLHRAYGQPAFEPGDAATLDALMPHLRRLNAVRTRLRRSTARAELLEAAFDGVRSGLIVADADARLLHANGRAEALLKAGDGLRMRRGRLAPRDEAAGERFAEAVRSAARRTGGRGGAMRLARAERSPLDVFVAPLGGAVPGALILVDDAAEGDEGAAQVLSRLYNLTSAEADLAALLQDGLSPSEAAQARDVRLSTVRSQIQMLLDKTDSRRLTDLIRTLARIRATRPR